MRVRLKQSALPCAAFLACGALTWWIAAQVPASGLEPTEIPGLYVRSHVVDVGLFAAGEERTATFEFVNRGAVPVTLSEVFASCSCTVAELEQKTVLPGEAIPLRASVRHSGILRPRGTGRSAFDRKLQVEVIADDGAKAEISLTVRGEMRYCQKSCSVE